MRMVGPGLIRGRRGREASERENKASAQSDRSQYALPVRTAAAKITNAAAHCCVPRFMSGFQRLKRDASGPSPSVYEQSAPNENRELIEQYLDRVIVKSDTIEIRAIGTTRQGPASEPSVIVGR
jgi:hypothetical protein